MSTIISESSITLSFPDTCFFRFEDCEGYHKIQNHLKEMDVCWFNSNKNELLVIELKDWSGGLSEDNPSHPNHGRRKDIIEGISEYRLDTIVKKSIDSVCMLMSGLLNYPAGLKVLECLPQVISRDTQVKLFTIVNWGDSDVSYISSMKSEYQSRFQPYARLFGVRTYTLITKDQALKNFDWVV